FELCALEPDSLVAILSENEGLSMLQINHSFVTNFFLREVLERAVIEYVAILEDFDKGSSLVLRRAMDRFHEVFCINVERSRHKRAFRRERDMQRIDGVIDRAHGCRFCFLAEFRSGRVLPFGESVDSVVEQDDLEIEVAADAMQKVIS